MTHCIQHDPAAFPQADTQWHALLAQASGNTMLEHLHRMMSDTFHTGCLPDMASLARHQHVR
jgi:DNA-binding FadR family transcriptional regulator